MKIINSVQGYRAIAILGIYLSHTYTFLGDEFRDCYGILSKLGYIGVAAFFMLSGMLFILKSEFVEEKVTIKKCIVFAWGKVSKLYTLHIITLILAFIGKFPEKIYTLLIDIFALPFQLTLTQAWFPWVGVIDSFNGPSWFLSGLFGVWLIISAIPRLVNKIFTCQLKCVILILLLLLLLDFIWIYSIDLISRESLPIKETWYYHYLSYRNPIVCFQKFFVGCLFGRVFQLIQFNKICINILQICSILVFFICVNHLPDKFWTNYIYELIIGSFLITILYSYTMASKILGSGIMVAAGNISGYFFLFHGAINFIIIRYVATPQIIETPYLFILSLLMSLMCSFIWSKMLNLRKICV